jgi:hypothetical protein
MQDMCSTAWVSLEPVEYPWTRWGGEPEGLHIKHGDIPVTVKVTWTDGTEGEVNAWTSQWTHTYVCVFRETVPPYHPFCVRASDVRRRRPGPM